MTRRLRTLFADVILGLLLVGASTGEAHAYLDPGTGAMIIQIVLGGVAGAVVVLRLYWGRFKDFFRRRPVEDTTVEDSRNDSS